MRDLLVPAGSLPQRLDTFLARVLPTASRRRARELIAGDAVRVNGRRKVKSSLVQPGDVVRIEACELLHPASLAPNPQLSVHVLYEDPHVIVVDKPAGMPAHALRSNETETLANFLLARYPELKSVGKGDLEPGLVHRLDTDTSGVLLVARTPAAYAMLKEQFAARTVSKGYLALVSGDVASAGEICAPIGGTRRDSRRVRVRANAEPTSRGSRPALTRYRPSKRFGNCTLLNVEIPTGVRHQIRAHLASINHPVLGDALYGREAAPRQMLHADRIAFLHPHSRALVSVESPLPDDMRKEITSRARGARTDGHRKRPPRRKGLPSHGRS